MGAWDSYTRDAEIGSGGGDFPVVEDGLFEAIIQDITEPRDGTDYNGDPCKKFVIKWEITSEDVAPDTVLWQYVTLPPKYLQEGVLSEKSNLYKVMTALGLAVAIPAVLGYNALVRGNKGVLAKLKHFAHDLHAYLVLGKPVRSLGTTATGNPLHNQ